MMVPAMIRRSFLSERAFDRLFQAMDRAMDGLIHGGFLMRHHNGLAAIATRLDHAAFVVMAGLVADGVAEVHIDPPDAVAEPVQRRMHDPFDVIGKLRAAMDIAVCSNLDQHRLLRECIMRLYTACTSRRPRCPDVTRFRLFDAPPLEEAFVRGVLLDVGGLALLCRIDAGSLGLIVGSNFGMVAGAFVTLVRRRDRWHMSMFRHWISLHSAIAQGDRAPPAR